MNLEPLYTPIANQLERLGFELVHLEWAQEGREGVLRIFVDHLPDEAGLQRAVTLDDCVAVNEGILLWMDVAFPSLREETGLEISSPGVERPLTKQAHFQRYSGRLCRIQTHLPVNGQKRFKGWIGDASDRQVTIEEDGVLKTVEYSGIAKARLAPFDEDSTPPPKHVQRRGAIEAAKPLKSGTRREGHVGRKKKAGSSSVSQPIDATDPEVGEFLVSPSNAEKSVGISGLKEEA